MIIALEEDYLKGPSIGQMDQEDIQEDILDSTDTTQDLIFTDNNILCNTMIQLSKIIKFCLIR